MGLVIHTPARRRHGHSKVNTVQSLSIALTSHWTLQLTAQRRLQRQTQQASATGV